MGRPSLLPTIISTLVPAIVAVLLYATLLHFARDPARELHDHCSRDLRSHAHLELCILTVLGATGAQTGNSCPDAYRRRQRHCWDGDDLHPSAVTVTPFTTEHLMRAPFLVKRAPYGAAGRGGSAQPPNSEVIHLPCSYLVEASMHLRLRAVCVVSRTHNVRYKTVTYDSKLWAAIISLAAIERCALCQDH